jgi:RNA-directed DNA polymerase
MGPARWPVPPIHDVAALATWLGVTPGHLAWFADRRSLERTAADERLRHHHRRWVRKGDGGLRLIEAPKRELKDLQR